jgi:hypothetical protein
VHRLRSARPRRDSFPKTNDILTCARSSLSLSLSLCVCLSLSLSLSLCLSVSPPHTHPLWQWSTAVADASSLSSSLFLSTLFPLFLFLPLKLFVKHYERLGHRPTSCTSSLMSDHILRKGYLLVRCCTHDIWVHMVQIYSRCSSSQTDRWIFARYTHCASYQGKERNPRGMSVMPPFWWPKRLCITYSYGPTPRLTNFFSVPRSETKCTPAEMHQHERRPSHCYRDASSSRQIKG